ncbi:MAG: Gfo/Idh/MocA family oxidoreductase [Planctomycetota bacterium]|nr:MAG: Gfo/Idh/MocA family oxidoreductase [Planctomycetota bacterium]
MKKRASSKANEVSRRGFIKATAAAGMAAVLGGQERLFAAGSDKIRVGLIGCGGQGTRDTISCLQSATGVELVAMGDLFRDRVDESLKKLKGEEISGKVKVTPEKCFVGFDAYKKVIASDVDMVLIVTPPHFHPQQVKAAIEAGKHVFMEKPGAVDPAGVRTLIAASELAEQKKLSIVAGTQRRHEAHYIEIMKRIGRGDIGEIVGGQVYWNGGDMVGYWTYYEKGGMSDMEWQCRNWPWFTWLGGDHIVEQHVHNVDIMHWAMGSHPVQVMGMGGRAVRKEGNIFDHFAIEYEFANGVRILGMCRQINGCHTRVGERFVGTKGVADGRGKIEGQNAYVYPGESPDPYVQEQADLIASIRQGKPINEGRNVAESTMSAIMGRMSAYTGRALKWDWAMNASKLDYTPPSYDFDIDFPARPVPVPGKTQLI